MHIEVSDLFVCPHCGFNAHIECSRPTVMQVSALRVNLIPVKVPKRGLAEDKFEPGLSVCFQETNIRWSDEEVVSRSCYCGECGEDLGDDAELYEELTEKFVKLLEAPTTEVSKHTRMEDVPRKVIGRDPIYSYAIIFDNALCAQMYSKEFALKIMTMATNAEKHGADIDDVRYLCKYVIGNNNCLPEGIKTCCVCGALFAGSGRTCCNCHIIKKLRG